MRNTVAALEPAPRVLIAIATYNERDNLPSLLREIHQHLPAADVLVIDDNSPDGTGKLADDMAAQESWLHVLHRPGKLGLGTALLAGMRYAMEHKYDYSISMDADFSHSPRYLPDLVSGMSKNDIMIGSRYVPGGGTRNWPLSRKLISRSVNALVRLLMRLPAHDCSGGFRCYRVACLQSARLDRLLSHGYSIQEEVLFRCWQNGCRIGETPIIFEERQAGASKVNLKEMVRSLGVLLYLGIGNLFGAGGRNAKESVPQRQR